MANAQQVNPIIAADRVYLKALGFEVTEYIGAGNAGQVFRGICNEMATKAYEIPKEDEHLYPPKHIWKNEQGKVLLEKSLSGKLCAIKRLNDRIKMAEAAVLMRLGHQNIVDVYNAISTDQNNSYVIMEFINGVHLGGLINTYAVTNRRFSGPEVKKMFVELVEGLDYLHKNGVTHGDIHYGNIMFHLEYPTVPEWRQIKYVDFGLAQVSQNIDQAIDPSDDIVKLGTVLNGILGFSNLSATHLQIYRDLMRISNKMQFSSDYTTVDQLYQVIDPVLEGLPSPQQPPPPPPPPADDNQ